MAPNTNESSRVLSRWWVILPVLSGFVVALVVGQWQPAAIAKAVGNSVGVVSLMPVIFWERRKEKWFLPFLLCATVAHVVLLVLVPWQQAPERHFGQKDIFFFFGVSDAVVTTVVGFIVLKLATYRSTS
jgi:hypothetical protein